MTSACPEQPYECQGPLRDAELRQLVRTWIEETADPDTVIWNELGILCGEVRADIVAVNGVLHGFELKSDRDSLRRLPAQAAAYSAVMDRASLVVAQRHLEASLAVVPSWWEVLVPVGSEGTLRRVRRGRANPGVNARALVQLLWYDDAIALLRAHNEARGAIGKPRRFVWERICEAIPLREIQSSVRSVLKTRAAGQGPAARS